MTTGNSNLPAERFGENSATSAGTEIVVPDEGRDMRSPIAASNAGGLLHNKIIIFGMTGAAMAVSGTTLFLLPAPDIAGRVLCLLAIALSYWVGCEWYNSSTAPKPDSSPASDPAVLQSIDQKMEQLEDAKWQLSDSAAHYRDLLDQHHDMIVRRNGAGLLTFANRAFCRKFDIVLEATLGQPIEQEAIESVELSLLSDVEPDADASERRYRDLMETVDGERWIEWESRQVGTGEDLEVQYTGRDVTEAVQAHQALEEARDQAQTANRSKSRFLASMSHEIRTPMNGILGMANLLNDEQLNEKQKTYVSAIDLSARNLLSIIDEILDFSKVEAGKITLSQRYLSIEDIVLSVVELLAPSAQEKGLEIAWTVDSAAQGEFVGDGARVRQILLNLVSNAVKFTDHGGVRVSVSAEDVANSGQDAPKRIEIRVSDTGIGLSKADQCALFSEFSQTDQAIKRQAGGTGLGLAISRRLAEAMGGSLTVESNVQTGSTFIARLELQPIFGASAGHTFATLQDTLKLKVLLAFERVLERAALAEVLSDSGIAVVECSLDEAATVAKQAAKNGLPFSRIIVDTDDDPTAASSALKTMIEAACAAGLKPHDVRGLVLVNISSRETLPAFQSVGYDAYLVRPVRPKTVFEQLIAERRNNQTATISAPSKISYAPQQPTASGLRFLLVEDNDINALLVDHQLKRLGHIIEHVSDGTQAVAAMEQVISGELEPFDVILMDVLMPEMDGLEATRQIKQLFASAATCDSQPPVIALTANAFDEDKQRCLDAGMDDYLAKPFDQHMLSSVLARCNLD